MSGSKRKVLITGCSEGGLGAALAIAFHDAGFHVFATARNPSKMAHLTSLGIETLQLDVLSDSSIAACVRKVSDSGIDILINNAGCSYAMPVSDLSIVEAKKLFDLNVWSYLAVAQAFLPLLIKSKGVIVNQTSISACITTPFQGAYNASKAAMSTFSDTERLELGAFGITVVELRTGLVRSNLIKNTNASGPGCLPKGSIYEPAREIVDKALRVEGFTDQGLLADQWAKAVVQDLSKKTPPPVIWRGEQAWLVRLSTVLPFGMFDGMIKKMSGINLVEQILRGF
jgi:1-acylglycerone phosphate reductase